MLNFCLLVNCNSSSVVEGLGEVGVSSNNMISGMQCRRWWAFCTITVSIWR